METVSAYEARVKFGNLLNRVYYGGTSFIIERYGTPLANLVPPAAETKKKRTKEKSKAKTKKRKESAMDKLMKFAGILNDEDAEVYMKVYKESRSEMPKEIPAFEFKG